MAGQDRDVEQDEHPAVGRHYNLIKSGLNTRPTISTLTSDSSGYIGVSEQTSLLSKHSRDPDHKGADSEIDSEEEEDRSGYEDEDDDEVLSVQAPGESVIAIVGLLMIGVFVSNADGSLVLASYGTISSDFGALADASWLTTSYSLASCAVQPITGNLSDIYGRKGVLLLRYVLFAIGSVGSGIGQAMWQVILGRVVAGLGAAGMTVIVSILITDLVPIVQVASWRSYVNVVATLGRSIGGPLGGFLADSIGWRWSFIGQGPIIGLAIILVALRLPSQTYPLAFPLLEGSEGQHKITSKPQISKIRRPLAARFVAWEKYGAFEPVFPPSLLIQRDVATSYAITAVQAAEQLAMMFSIPLYFRATQNSSNTLAGTHLFPAVLGNTLGGLLSGFYISRTERYKPLCLLAALSSSLSHTLLILRWRGQCITWLDSFDIVPGGFGTGIAFSAAFIAFTASVKRRNMAVATSGLYLCSGLGFVLGVAGASSVQITTLRTLLGRALEGVDGAREVSPMCLY
ncbi:related to multidrug resistance protein fnx1 [Rhynchosporium secalis]|uniref:Related to multidrug resistance protein fnx1 n=1 Tax=Rhynchosporium secalis TaxID=38038 RepID=A0A1E1M7G2_RHYSE|nr:related to multidrug resistance protein fnx1 [Rhynchosporium secalis]